MILSFAKGVRKTVIIGLEPDEARAVLRGGTVEAGNGEMFVLIGRASEIGPELLAAAKRTGTQVELQVKHVPAWRKGRLSALGGAMPDERSLLDELDEAERVIRECGARHDDLTAIYCHRAADHDGQHEGCSVITWTDD